MPLSLSSIRAGQSLDNYDYHDDAEPVSWQVPGSPTGQVVTPLRTWSAVDAALSKDNRDLSLADPDDAIFGIGRECPYGLMRLDASRSRSVRSIINPLFSPAAIARWDGALSLAARGRAAALVDSGDGDLVTGYVAPLLADMVRLTAGLDRHQWEDLQDLVGRADGLIATPGDHVVVDGARKEFRDFASQVTIARTNREPARDLVSQCASALQHHLPDHQSLPVMMNVLAGWPSAGPAVLAAVLLTIMSQEEEVLATCRDPVAALPAVREALRLVAPFTCLVPGVLTTPIQAGRLTLPAGTLALPVIRAAYRDPAYAGAADPGTFRLNRPRRLVLAFGAGTHRCPAYSLMIRFFGIAVSAIVNAESCLAVPAETIPLQAAGLMRTPQEIPVTRAEKPRR